MRSDYYEKSSSICCTNRMGIQLANSTKIIDQSVYSYFNYQLMAIGFAISLLVGIILLWFIKRKEQ